MKSFEAQLRELVRDLEKLPNDIVEEIKDLDDNFVSLLEKNHKQGKDPYGHSWEPRKKSYAWPILNKSGHLLNSYNSNKSGKSVSISNTADYAAYVDSNRTLIPEDDIPDKWMKLIEKELDLLIKDFNNKK